MQERGGDGAWHCFDDTTVTPWDPSNMAAACFGGPSGADGPVRSNSAFMLIYERRDEFEPVRICPALQPPPAARATSHPIDTSDSGGAGAPAAAPAPRAVPYGMPPQLYAQIMQARFRSCRPRRCAGPRQCSQRKAMITKHRFTPHLCFGWRSHRPQRRLPSRAGRPAAGAGILQPREMLTKTPSHTSFDQRINRYAGQTAAGAGAPPDGATAYDKRI